VSPTRDDIVTGGGRAAAAIATSVATWLMLTVPSVAQAPAAGDPVAGEKVFTVCSACHHIGVGATNSVGPVLNGVVGRPAGTYPGFAYSDANKKSGAVWNEATLAKYLPDPKAFIPGTTMPIGVPDAKDVTDVIAYLKLFDAQGNNLSAPAK
jgi:cytochrome c